MKLVFFKYMKHVSVCLTLFLFQFVKICEKGYFNKIEIDYLKYEKLIFFKYIKNNTDCQTRLNYSFAVHVLYSIF